MLANLNEANEIGANIIENSGLAGVVLFKSAATGAFVLWGEFGLRRQLKRPALTGAIYIILSGVLGAVLFSNTAQTLMVLARK